MNTVAEIVSAIERLPSEQMEEIAAWLEQFRSTVGASAIIFSQLDAEESEGEQWQQPK